MFPAAGLLAPIRQFVPRNFNIRNSVDLGDGLVLAERGGIQVRIANKKQSRSFYRLRKKVFGKEYQGKIFNFGLDVDEYDFGAEQIVLLDKNSGKVIGGYRAIVSENIRQYYSADEFELEKFWKLPGKKLELSRACISEKYRNGVTLSLLWRGVLSYAFHRQVAFICGIPSVKTTCPKEAKMVYELFAKKGYTGPVLAEPKPEFSTFGAPTAESLQREPESMIPPLMKTYLKAGSKICSVGAIDHSFGCVDFFTVLKMADLDQRYRNKFG